MKNKPRYIWLSVPAFIFLSLGTLLRCLILVPRKECLQATAKYILWMHVFAIGMFHPVLLVSIFTQGETLVGAIILWIAMYIGGVGATYGLVWWREKKLKPLIKKKY
ncbi:MAG: hypothetical protein FWE28_04530 [Oscillospiraceae bacterium]|nr:hypothetical protein [Oscillospiraceae bacterium]